MNHVTLQGHFSAVAEERTLPSGDVIAVFRLVVPREDGSRVDTIDCAVSGARLRKRTLRVRAGDEIVIEGALHRRFWKTPSGIASRYEVAVHSLERVS